MDLFQGRNITSADAGTTVTLAGTGDYSILHLIVINKADAHTLTIQDSNGNTYGTMKASIVENSYFYDIAVLGALKIVVPAAYAGDATVSYR